MTTAEFIAQDIRNLASSLSAELSGADAAGLRVQLRVLYSASSFNPVAVVIESISREEIL